MKRDRAASRVQGHTSAADGFCNLGKVLKSPAEYRAEADRVLALAAAAREDSTRDSLRRVADTYLMMAQHAEVLERIAWWRAASFDFG